MAQRAVKQKAESLGLLLRPQDPNVAGAMGKKPGSGNKRAGRSGAARSADSLLGAGGGGGAGSNPLTKKVKVSSGSDVGRGTETGGQREGRPRWSGNTFTTRLIMTSVQSLYHTGRQPMRFCCIQLAAAFTLLHTAVWCTTACTVFKACLKQEAAAYSVVS